MIKKLNGRRRQVLPCLSASVLLLASCSSAPSREPGTGRTGGAATLPAAASAGQMAVSQAPVQPMSEQPTLIITRQPTAAVPDAGLPPGVCKATSSMAEKVPVDVFMMIDQSASMVAVDSAGVTRWQNVIDALTQFIQAPESAGLGLGVQYFGLGTSCEPADYAKAEVEIGPLPDNAQAILDSFANHMPTAVTPTAPALKGAIQHAQAYKADHPAHTVAVLLVTDGEPDACIDGLDLAAGNIDVTKLLDNINNIGPTVDAAASGVAAASSTLTYVLGVGDKLEALDKVAAGGGTQHAFIVGGNQNVSGQVLEALNSIRSMAALPCEFEIPKADPGMPFDYAQVNLTYTPPNGTETSVGYTSDISACDNAPLAWRYDDPKAPTKFVLCDKTCKAAASGGKVAIALHCPTIPLN